MQMTGATAHQLPANRSPPTPMVQTPVGAPTTPPVFPKVEPEGVSSSTTTIPATPTTEGAGETAAAEVAPPPPATQNHVDHARTVSQSSGASSNVPELVPANSAINNN